MADVTRRRRTRRKPQQEHGERLLRVLRANLAHTRDAALRERLKRAIAELEKKAANARAA